MMLHNKAFGIIDDFPDKSKTNTFVIISKPQRNSIPPKHPESFFAIFLCFYKIFYGVRLERNLSSAKRLAPVPIYSIDSDITIILFLNIHFSIYNEPSLLERTASRPSDIIHECKVHCCGNASPNERNCLCSLSFCNVNT